MQRPRSHAAVAAAVANKARSSPALDARQEVESREELQILQETSSTSATDAFGRRICDF